MARGEKALTASLADRGGTEEELLVLGYMTDWSTAQEIFGLWVDTEGARGPTNSA